MIKAPCILIWNLKHHHEHNCQHHYQYFLIISIKIHQKRVILRNKEREKRQLSHDLHGRGNKCQPHAFFSASHAFSLKFAQLKV